MLTTFNTIVFALWLPLLTSYKNTNKNQILMKIEFEIQAKDNVGLQLSTIFGHR
jgi:hypothetical protein